MRHPHKSHLAPRRVILIYLISILEAIGLSIYFRARLIDAEMASMQALQMENQQARSGLAARQPACDQCLLLARSPHQAAVKSQ